MQSTFLALSVGTGILAAALYISTIIRSTTRPHVVTRFVLLIVSALALTSILAADANAGSVAIVSIVFAQSLIIFLLSFRYGVIEKTIKQIGVFDLMCFVIALAGVVVWQTTGNPLTAIICSILADFVAYVPAFVKTWKRPATESHWLYSLSIVSKALSLVAYDLRPASAFQIYLIICAAVMLICIYHTHLHKLLRRNV